MDDNAQTALKLQNEQMEKTNMKSISSTYNLKKENLSEG